MPCGVGFILGIMLACTLSLASGCASDPARADGPAPLVHATPPGSEPIPQKITATFQYPGQEPISFNLVLVPGDPSRYVKPFYMATHEVTWEMFQGWALGMDLTGHEYYALTEAGLRPSPVHEYESQSIGLGKRPAIGMNRRVAIAYADWLSAKTGLRLRIPTKREWDLALRLGGGVPSSRESLLEQGVFLNNAEEQYNPPFMYVTAKVGSKTPNALGIYDLLGNAAEWVRDRRNEKRLVVGGHFQLDLDDVAFDASWNAVEDQDVWNETYPQRPVSRFWYCDHYYQGIRLVAEMPKQDGP